MYTIVQVLLHTFYVLNTENVLFYLKSRLLCTFGKYMYNYLCTAAHINICVFNDMPLPKSYYQILMLNYQYYTLDFI